MTENKLSSVSALVRSLRTLRVMLYLPKDQESERLWRHIKRIGCQAQVAWPPPREVPKGTDIVFLAMSGLVDGDLEFQWDPANPDAALIAVADYENPLVIEKMVSMRAQGVVSSPIRSAGVLPKILLALAAFKRERRLAQRIERLEAKLKAGRVIEEAKAILARTHRVTEKRAYAILREQAMNKRTTVEAIAVAVINASDLLKLSGVVPEAEDDTHDEGSDLSGGEDR